MKEVFVAAIDGYELSLRDYDIQTPKAVIQIAHGMEEHQLRYEGLAYFLNEQGFAVVTADMRGHGPNAETLGFFAEKDGHRLLVSDMLSVRSYIDEEYSGVPVYLIAHSMGTIISRVLLQKHSDKYEKVVLMGYPSYQACACFGITLAKLIMTTRGKMSRSKTLQHITTGAFNKKIKSPRTSVDWICKNTDSVDAYLADPLCGFGFTSSAYSDLYALVELMHHHNHYVNVNSELRILMLRGTEDFCTGGKKGAADSRKVLLKAGFNKLAYKDYNGVRHEIINECVRDEVFSDIAEFFNS